LVGIDLIQFSTDYVKTFLNWLRTSCTVSIATAATLCLEKKLDCYECDIGMLTIFKSWYFQL